MALADHNSAVKLACHMDEASGNALDSSGNGYDLTDNGSVGAGTGKLSGARDFEAGAGAGTQSFSHADNADLSAGDNDLTLAVWIKVESFTVTCAIVQKGEAGTLEYALVLTSGGELRWNVYDSGINETRATWGTLSTATWYLVVCRHDSVNNKISVNVNNGTPVETATSAGINDSTGTLRVGNRPSADTPYDGLVDELIWWKGYVLSSADESELYASGSGLAYPFSGGGSAVSMLPLLGVG